MAGIDDTPGSKTVIADLDGTPAAEQFLDLDDDKLEVEIQPQEPEEPEDEDDLDGEIDDQEPEPEPLNTAEDGTSEREVDEDLRGMSRRVQDRIMRERRLRQRDRDVLERQLREERARRIESDRLVANSSKLAVEGQIAQAKKDLAAAIEAGDSEKQADLQTKISELAAKKQQVEALVQSLEREATTARTAPASANPELDRWKQRNRWFDDPQHEPARLYAIGIDKKLVAKGMDPTSPEYFREIDRLVSQRFPELYRGRMASRQVNTERRRNLSRGPVQSPASPAAAGAAPNRVAITREDIATMRRFGLDPNDKSHVIRFAREKRAEDMRRRS